ncbi:MAG: PfkB family carbohydrate kinase, partial [Acidimicrobiales bacterium]
MVLGVLGDLIEDIVVTLGGPIQLASDTESRIVRRRGGSAANVAAAAASLGHRARFLGQVGDDAIGTALVAELAVAGVDTDAVRRGGSTGTIIVLVDEQGERSMLTDRRSCRDLDKPDPAWLDGITTLHVPLYGLDGGALAATARTLTSWAREQTIAVSIDASSTALVDALGGRTATRGLITELAPDVLFANDDEATALGIDNAELAPLTVVKRGAAAALVYRPGVATVEVPTAPLPALTDSTGAGDAFAAGF